MKSVAIVLAVALCSTGLLFGQVPDEVVLPDYVESGGKYISDQIQGDTTALGARTNPNRTYILKRNGTYLSVSSIRNTNWPLALRAQNGPGQKPAVFTWKNPVTGQFNQPFDMRGNLSLKNVVLLGWSSIPADKSLMSARVIQVNAAGFNLVMDSCLIVGTAAAAIQVPTATHLITVTNTTFAQSGNVPYADVGNGRAFDLRNVSVDSVILRNCTFIDGIDRVVRHRGSSAALGLFVFDHNTIFNNASYHGCLELGTVGQVEITNNLFVDNFVLGRDSTDDVRLGEFNASTEKEPNGKARMTFISTAPDTAGQPVPSVCVVRKNYYAVTPAVQAWYNTNPRGYLGLGSLIPLTYNINKKIGADSVNAFKKDTIAFTKSTSNLIPFATWYWDPAGADKKKVGTGWSATYDMQRSSWPYYIDTLNLRYQTTRPAYTGADGGKPAGSLMWWNLPLTGVGTSQENEVPQGYSLSQNYPNPFNPSTEIGYQLPATGHVSLVVYDLLGREVATLVNEIQSAGTYAEKFDARALSSGMYFYRLTSGSFSSARKMMLVR